MPKSVDRISLNGKWEASIDFAHAFREDLNAHTQWRDIIVPGCWEQIEANKQADGPVWYRRSFDVPSEWMGRRVALDFGGVNYYCEIYVNGGLACKHEGGWSGFQARVEGLLAFGAENELLIMVYKQGVRFPLRASLAGFLPDVGVIFGGIWKPVHLQLVPDVVIRDVFAKPRVLHQAVEVEFTLLTVPSDTECSVTVAAEIKDKHGKVVSRKEQTVKIPSAVERVEDKLWLMFEDAISLWSPESPTLYQLHVAVLGDTCEISSHDCRFGMKELEIYRDQFLLNGKPIYLRGVLHWGWYADTIAPIPSRDEIREELKRVKESGFNLVKHCLYVPVKDYYELADEMGVLLWQEMPMWLPEVTPEFKERTFAQFESILREVRNHPSLSIWTLGCELDQSADSTFLQELYAMAKSLTDQAIIRDNSGSGECYGGLLKEYADFYDYHFYTDFHFFPDLLSQFAGSWREDKPWVFGEFCDYDEFRNLDTTLADHGGELPWWLQYDEAVNPVAKEERWQYSRQAEKLAKLNLPFSHAQLWNNANRSAFVYRKAVLEFVRTYAKISGYVITSIKDNPIATSAVFDDKGQPKQLPEKFRMMNDATVMTLTWDNRRSWIGGGDRLVRWDPFNYTAGTFIRPHLIISHYGSSPLEDGLLTWKMVAEADGNVLGEGVLSSVVVHTGEVREIGVLEIAAPEVETPSAVTLRATLTMASTSDEAPVCNAWTLWVYPKPALTLEEQSMLVLDDPFHVFAGLSTIYPGIRTQTGLQDNTRVVITSQLLPEHESFMEQGGKVLFVQRSQYGPFALKQLSFSRESLQLFHDHPVMNRYPHEGHTSLSMFGLATDTVFDYASLPAHQPLMERLDARLFERAGYMFESAQGQGTLIATTLRFEGGLGAQPQGIVNNTGARYLLDTTIKYLLEG
ncbi:glycoside hydrolase family 2 protein [Paenibacillus silvestris]|nr:sugar-binding domain-containing protein [Paenibacillus silvestris]